MNKILIGADPELFIKDADGKLVSCHGLLPGTKEEPHIIEGVGAVQVDGMAAEYNINPCEDVEQFVLRNKLMQKTILNMLPKGYSLAHIPVAKFGKRYIDKQPEVARELGCEPDFNAWEGGKINPEPDAKQNFRTAAGHIHMGWTEGMDINDPEHVEACCIVVRNVEDALRIYSSISEENNIRSKLYGKPGAMRVKSYGVEIRNPSNFWTGDELHMRNVYNIVYGVVQGLFEGKDKKQKEPFNIFNNFEGYYFDEYFSYRYLNEELIRDRLGKFAINYKKLPKNYKNFDLKHYKEVSYV